MSTEQGIKRQIQRIADYYGRTDPWTARAVTSWTPSILRIQMDDEQLDAAVRHLGETTEHCPSLASLLAFLYGYAARANPGRKHKACAACTSGQREVAWRYQEPNETDDRVVTGNAACDCPAGHVLAEGDEFVPWAGWVQDRRNDPRTLDVYYATTDVPVLPLELTMTTGDYRRFRERQATAPRFKAPEFVKAALQPEDRATARTRSRSVERDKHWTEQDDPGAFDDVLRP